MRTLNSSEVVKLRRLGVSVSAFTSETAHDEKDDVREHFKYLPFVTHIDEVAYGHAFGPPINTTLIW